MAEAFLVYPAELRRYAASFEATAAQVRRTAESSGVQAPGALGPVVEVAFSAFASAWRDAGRDGATVAETVGPSLRANATAYRLSDSTAAAGLARLRTGLPTALTPPPVFGPVPASSLDTVLNPGAAPAPGPAPGTGGARRGLLEGG